MTFNLTPHELTQKTLKDIAIRRSLRGDGKKQASMHCIENRLKIRKQLSHGKY